MRTSLVLLVSLFATGCGAVSPAAVTTTTTPAPATDMQPTEASSVLVLQTTKLDRYAEVVGVVDVHEGMGDERLALQRLREKAAAMGADAVVGVEFHHGEGEGEPTHLSGMAVRFVPPPALPMR
jgi:hypothetical protein